MPQLSRLATILFLLGITGVSAALAQNREGADETLRLAQNQTTSPVTGPSILPEAPGTVNGGNPFQGLGRPDDTGPLRANPILQYTPGNNTNGLFSTGSSFPSTPSVEQPGFGGQAGFSSNNTGNFPATMNPASNQSSIPGNNQAPGETNPGPNAALMPNLNPVPQSVPESNGDTAGDTRANQSNSENGFSLDKLLNRSHQNRSKSIRETTTREVNQLSIALKEMNSGNYTKCLETLNSIIKDEPKNAQAYYVKAVTNVLMRDFAPARQNYEMTLRCTNDEQLIKKTKAGLLKLGR